MEKMREIYGPEPPQPVRTYKDRLFRMIFKDKAEFLTLYNALNGTSYDDPEALKITTLEHAVQQAVDACIENGILTKFLKEHKAEEIEQLRSE